MADSLNQKLNALAAKIDAQTEKARRTQVITVVVGIIFIVVLLVYFGFMSGLTKEALEPQGVATMLGDTATTQIKSLNKEAQTFIKSEAPVLINNVITRALDEQLPEGRKTLEESIKSESSKLLQKYEDEIYKGVDDALAKYGANIKEFASKLRTEEGTKEFEDAVYGVIDEAVSSDEIRMELDTYGEALKTIDGTLERLVSAEDLTEDEIALRHLLQVVREITRRSELNNLKVDLSVDVKTPGVEGSK